MRSDALEYLRLQRREESPLQVLAGVIGGKDALFLGQVDALVVNDVLDPVKELIRERDGLIGIVLETEFDQHVPEAREAHANAARLQARVSLLAQRVFVGV